jgi:hypothetical protein
MLLCNRAFVEGNPADQSANDSVDHMYEERVSFGPQEVFPRLKWTFGGLVKC